MKNNNTTTLTSLAINAKEDSGIPNTHIRGAGGFYAAQVTTEQRDQIPLKNGLIVYNVSTQRFEFYQEDVWRHLNFAFDDSVFHPESANKILKVNGGGSQVTVGVAKETMRA